MRKSGDEKKKYTLAAKKAWKTINDQKRIKANKNVEKLDKFASPSCSDNEWKGNKIVTRFDKTPEDIACGGFWELRWAFGCPFNCSYCYLRGTLKGKMQPRYIKIEHIIDALREAFRKIRKPSTFNTGELCDSLMNPPLMEEIVDFFEKQRTHKVYLLTKSGPMTTEFLTKKPRKQTICAWSINAPIVSSRWEMSAAHPIQRIEAARSVSEIGYDTRVRIDPIFPMKNWKIHYEDLVRKILSNLTPRRIILGTPRGLWKTIKYAKSAGLDTTWTQYFTEDTGWGRKLSFKQRKEIYMFMFDKIEEMGYPKSKVSICKDTVSIMKSLRVAYVPYTCNCYGTG
jgi:spore photoproduct lyase